MLRANVRLLMSMFLASLLFGCAVKPSEPLDKEFNNSVLKKTDKDNAQLILWRNWRFVSGGVWSAFYIDEKRIGELKSGLFVLEVEPGMHILSNVFPSEIILPEQLPSKVARCNIKIEVKANKTYSFYQDSSFNNTSLPSGCYRMSGLLEGVHPDAYGQTVYKPQNRLITKRSDDVDSQSKAQVTNKKKPAKISKPTSQHVRTVQPEPSKLAKINPAKSIANQPKPAVPATVVKKPAVIKPTQPSASKNVAQRPKGEPTSYGVENTLTDGGYQWKQTKAELAVLPAQLRGGYQLFNEVYFYDEGYFLRLSWRENPNSGQQENGSIKNGAWKKIGNKIVTQEYLWSMGNRYAYREVEYMLSKDKLTRVKNTIYYFRDSRYHKKGEVDELPIGKNAWQATKGRGPRKFNEYLNGEFSMYIGQQTKDDLNINLAKKNALRPTKWKQNQSVQPWQNRE